MQFSKYWLMAGGILILLALLVFFSVYSNNPQKSLPALSTEAAAKQTLTTDLNYMGSKACATCHQGQFKSWQKSHHDQSMQHASSDTVKGNFENATFSSLGQNSLFYQKENRFFVKTAGPDGKLSDYQILYTFGTTPLQQYIVSFPDGKLQTLPIAWDTMKKRWFHLQESQNPQPNEWIYWTNGGLNWNSMCADCHSTNLKKNYHLDQQSYNTTWSVIDVGCEACHGPGKTHMTAVEDDSFQPGINDPKIDMQVGEDSHILVDKCGRCHSRRQQLTEVFKHDSDELLDHYLPTVLQPGLYHSDGQILDEVFVYGSFVQSKMYHNNVSCIDCHEPHSARLKIEGNNLCASCHTKDQYDTPSHHHHPANLDEKLVNNEDSLGNQCVDCHMPGRTYMGNDFRRDHSFRIPRPDLSVQYDTPNACNACHKEESAQWAASAVEDWFGKERQPHFSEVLALSEAQPEAAIRPLLVLLVDPAQPAIARATAAHILTPLMALPHIREAMDAALSDKEPLLRTMAANAFSALSPPDKLQALSRLLKDEVRSVRIAAARSLIEINVSQIPQAMHADFETAKNEYIKSLNINAEFPSTQLQIAMDHHKQEQLIPAERAYSNALKIDNHYNAARINLAQLYYQQQRLSDAERLYREVINQEPNVASAHYALGLLMAEQGDFDEAKKFLGIAGEMGSLPRAWYNLAVIHHQQKEFQNAEQAYLKALDIDPFNPDFLNGLFILYTQQQAWQKANELINPLLTKRPSDTFLLQLKNALEQRQKSF